MNLLKSLSPIEYTDILEVSTEVNRYEYDTMWILEVDHPKKGRIILIQGAGNGGLILENTNKRSIMFDDIPCEIAA